MNTNKESYPVIGKEVNLNLEEITNPAVIRLAFQDRAIKSDWLKHEIDVVFDFLHGKPFEEQLEILAHYCNAPKNEKEEFTSEDVIFMLDHLGLQTHYLGSKPLYLWNEYDHSNYENLKRKATSRIRRVYAFFGKDIAESDKYRVDSPPTRFYTTKEEAESKLLPETLETVNIYALWIQE